MYELLATTPEQRQLRRVVASHRGILALNGKSSEGCIYRRACAGDSVRNARGVRLVGWGGGWMGSGQLACMGAERLFYITPLCSWSEAEAHNVCYVKIALVSGGLPYPARVAQGVGCRLVRLGDLACLRAVDLHGAPRVPAKRGKGRAPEGRRLVVAEAAERSGAAEGLIMVTVLFVAAQSPVQVHFQFGLQSVPCPR